MMKRCLLPTFVLSLVFAHGCGYGKVSPRTYEIATSLYNISNRKLAGEHVELVRQEIATATEGGLISEKEAKWLGDIVSDLETENWQAAMSSARRILDDQISRKAQTGPATHEH